MERHFPHISHRPKLRYSRLLLRLQKHQELGEFCYYYGILIAYFAPLNNLGCKTLELL
jgi:hypothetical protein